jgi:glutathione S-transferase
MELFYSPGACSMAPHICLIELGYDYKITPLQLKSGEQKKPEYLKLNPKGSVPALKVKENEVITEVAVILQFLADQKPEKKALPASGTMERVRANEWLNYISSELHKGFGAYFRLATFKPETASEMRNFWNSVMTTKMDFVSTQLAKTEYITGAQFSVADGYLFTVLNWTGMIQFDLTPWPSILSFMERMKARPSVQQALKEEGLI